jgi:HEAT repeat protein
MTRLTLFLLCIFSLLLYGCCQRAESSYEAQLSRAEDHFLKIEPKPALEILEKLSGSPNLPQRYFDLKTRVHLRAFQFNKALKTAFDWEKSSGRLQKARVKHILISFLRHGVELKNRAVRLEAVKSLGELNDLHSKDLVMSLFPPGSRAMRITVCYAMALLGDEKRALPYLRNTSRHGPLKERFLSAIYLSQLKRQNLVADYQKLLQDPDDTIRAVAIKVLGELNVKEASEKIMELYLHSSSMALRLIAAQSLVRLGQASYRQFLDENTIKGKHQTVAKLLLMELGERKFTEEIKSRISTLGVEEKYSAVKTLLETGDEETVAKDLRATLSNLMGDVFQKKMALELLANLKDENDLKLMATQFSSPFQEVQVIAAKAMLTILQ